jgi:hypothetical protein
MKKNTLNYIVDIFMFLLMMAVIGIGFLMRFILITGQEKWIKYGRNVEESFLGLDRHGWGRIHLIIGLILFAVLILHLILHWKSITGFFMKAFASRVLRISLVSVLLFGGILLVIFPFMVNPEVTDIDAGYGQLHREGRLANPDSPPVVSSDEIISTELKPDKIPECQSSIEEVHNKRNMQREELKAEIEVKGFMTLGEVCRKYNVEADQIKRRMGIPISTSNNEKLGRLRQRYGFNMIDVTEAIDAERQ